MENKEDRLKSFITTPLSERGVPVYLVYLIGLLGLVYILNPTAGIIELIPDNIPIIGNLDEGGAFLAIWYGLLEYMERKRKRSKSGTSDGI